MALSSGLPERVDFESATFQRVSEELPVLRRLVTEDARSVVLVRSRDGESVVLLTEPFVLSPGDATHLRLELPC